MKKNSTGTIKAWLNSNGAPAELTVFFAALLLGSIPTSPFLISIAMWGLVFMAFWNLALERAAEGDRQSAESIGLVVWELLVRSFRRLFAQRVYAVLLLLLLVPAVSGLWSDDLGYWLERTRVRLPFLVLPWAFANMPALSGRQLRLVLYILVWFMVLLCLGVGANYLLHHDAILEAMQQGQPMPVPRNHIRFSLLLATAVITGGYLWREGFVWRYRWERPALAVGVLFLFGFVHFLSVRSGLVALYAALFFTLCRFVWRTRRWKPALVLLIVLTLVPWLAVRTFPSLEQKLAYMAYDWEQYAGGTGENYSDAERWISLKTGWLIWRENPVLGVGAGDLPQETRRVVRQHFPDYRPTPKLPHNQFLYLLASTGILGFLISMGALIYPVFFRRYRSDYLFAVFQLMAFCSFLVEYTLETAMGVAWYLFFTLWFGKRDSG